VKTSIATVSLSGDLGTKLHAIAAAGFDGFELFDADLTSSTLSPEAVRGLAADLGLTLFALQPFRDFEGMLDAARGAAMTRAERKFDLMERLGTDLLLIPSNCLPSAADGVDRAAADFRELGDRAAQRGFRVAYEALAWGRHVRDWTAAWEIVKRADHLHVGLVLDTYHLFVRGNSLAPIRSVPVDKLFMVQLADAPSLDMEVLRHSRHMRNFPGQGDYPIVDFVAELLAIGYDGVLSHEIFNDDFRTAPATQTAVDGYRSMVWLEEQLLARRDAPTILLSKTPAPNHWTDAPRPMPVAELTGFSFVEFSVADSTEHETLTTYLRRVGFELVCTHQTKQVELYSLGSGDKAKRAWVAVTAEPNQYTMDLATTRGTSVCGIGLVSSNVAASLARAEAYKCQPPPPVAGELELPSVIGVGGAMVYFIQEGAPHFSAHNFRPVLHDPTVPAGPGTAMRIDHVAQAVAPYELLSATLFYRSLLGLQVQPPLEFADLNGLVTSRTVVSPNGAIRIPLNTASSAATSPERFRSGARGSGVQHIAIAADSLDDVLSSIDPTLVLPIPANYYDDLSARFDLSEATISYLCANSLLYDRSDAGEYLHLYTQEVHGLFFEFVQRVNYVGFGAANAPIRLAAQAHHRTPAHSGEGTNG
jgi:4-hydroxyphenylpyruvate dioxygenase